MTQLFANNAASTLSAGVTAAATSMTVAPGDGAQFPSPTGGDFFLVTLLKLSGVTESSVEIVKVTQRTGDVFNVVARAQEGTAARAYLAGDVVSARATAGSLHAKADALALASHAADAANPHGVTKGQVGLGAADNTSDAAKPVSTAQQAALNLKVDKAAGKQLSTEDYSTAEKSKLAGIAAGATVYSHPSNHPANVITQDASNRFVTDAEKATWNAKQAAGNYATGGGTATGTNTGDQVIPTTLPASDVSAWAKAATKPAYTKSEVGLGSVDNTADSAKPVSAAQAAALNAKLSDAPSNGKTYARKDAAWVETGGVAEVAPPTNTSPASAATAVGETPALTGSAFFSLYNAAHESTQVQVHTSNTFASPLYDSGSVAGAISVTVPAATLAVSSTYHWRMRYKNSRGTWSEWSTATSFTTAANFNSYIATPTATPAFGAALEGGFYAGMIWNELVQSTTSTAIGTGSKSFAVPSMTGAPIVYAGQTLEVRSRANPDSKMVGAVTGATGTTLTINVTSVGGSGTFTDWSIMSRYRVIVAPKASGENGSIAYKNANSAAPAACGTLTEGRKATLAMVGADTATVYPAAHWCNSLNIGSRTDWYLPARDELELCWRNLKPTTTANYAGTDRPSAAEPNYQNLGSYGGAENAHGLNKNSAPAGAAYTGSVPAQTGVAAFQTGGTEAYEFGSAYYWSSSEYGASVAWGQYWFSSNPGGQNNSVKTSTGRVRAVRRSVI